MVSRTKDRFETMTERVPTPALSEYPANALVQRIRRGLDRKWELLNGYPPGNPADPTNPFVPNNMFRTGDGRRILPMNIHPSLKRKALAFLACHDNPTAIGEVVRKWGAFDLEEAMNRACLRATVVRSSLEFLTGEQARYTASSLLIEIEKVGDSDPPAFTANPVAPLSGVRALGNLCRITNLSAGNIL